MATSELGDYEHELGMAYAIADGVVEVEREDEATTE
jgi:hypothetical protein